MESNQPRRFYLLTHPRTASNLLVRILALDQQPNVQWRERGGYFFLNTIIATGALGLRGRNVDEWTDEEKAQIRESYQKDFDELEQHIVSAEADGKIVFVKEHSYFLGDPTYQPGRTQIKDDVPFTVKVPSRYNSADHQVPSKGNNKTILPEGFIRTWLPIFLIRHPALVFPSQYRARRSIQQRMKTSSSSARIVGSVQRQSGMDLFWQRHLYDWYADYYHHLNLSRSSRAKPGPSDEPTWPIVLDADDIIDDESHVLITRLCSLVGLDASKLRFSWDPAAEEDLAGVDDLQKVFLSTLTESNGIRRDKSAAKIDNIDEEAKKWRAEFGESAGGMIERCVRDAMPDYEFLRSKRLRPSGIVMA